MKIKRVKKTDSGVDLILNQILSRLETQEAKTLELSETISNIDSEVSAITDAIFGDSGESGMSN